MTLDLERRCCWVEDRWRSEVGVTDEEQEEKGETMNKVDTSSLAKPTQIVTNLT